MESLQRKMEDRDVPVIFTGFDGYVDTMVKIIRSAEEKQNQYFSEMREFGNYLYSKSGKSCSLEISKIVEQGGGNSTLYAKALTALGCQVKCVGAYGYPEVNDVFRQENQDMELYSVSNPGYCMALEFDDGKVMLSENKEINEMNYQTLRDRIGEEKLINLMDEASVLSFMNWSEMPGCTDIWEGLLDNIFPKLTKKAEQMIFLDISDCSRRTAEEIGKMLELIHRFSCCRQVVISLNRNEFETVYTRVWNQDFPDFALAGRRIRERAGADILVIHETDSSSAITGEEVLKVNNRFIEQPLFSTGGGDNFNAGLVYGLVNDMDIKSAMVVANAASGYYITNGKSAGVSEILEYIRNWQLETGNSAEYFS